MWHEIKWGKRRKIEETISYLRNDVDSSSNAHANDGFCVGPLTVVSSVNSFGRFARSLVPSRQRCLCSPVRSVDAACHEAGPRTAAAVHHGRLRSRARPPPLPSTDARESDKNYFCPTTRDHGFGEEFPEKVSRWHGSYRNYSSNFRLGLPLGFAFFMFSLDLMYCPCLRLGSVHIFC